MADKLFTVETLATLGGASFLTYLVVAYTKTLVQKALGITTDIYSVIVGFIVVLLAQFAMGASPFNWIVYFLSVANGFLVAAAAGKMNDKAITEYEKRFETDARK
ncbi:MAG: hypothetical protein HPY55_01435 [Firmicutes bacterium]|nr:hypothetical protein [Bacillota bacterium]